MRAGPCDAHIASACRTVYVKLRSTAPRDLHGMRIADEYNNLAQFRAAVGTLQVDVRSRRRQIAAVPDCRSGRSRMIR
jgi:hypothetical protein